MGAQLGKFIVFEGVDGCGKTTQRDLYATRLRDRFGSRFDGDGIGLGRSVVKTGEPFGEIGALIRATLFGKHPKLDEPATLARLFAASRQEHIEKVIRPALEHGCVVLCDRYMPSSIVFQGCAPQESQMRSLLVKHLVLDLNQGIPTPDVTVVFDVSSGVARGRITQRAGTASQFDAAATATIEARSAVYRDLGKHGYVGRVELLDADGSVEDVQVALRALLDPIVFGEG